MPFCDGMRAYLDVFNLAFASLWFWCMYQVAASLGVGCACMSLYHVMILLFFRFNGCCVLLPLLCNSYKVRALWTVLIVQQIGKIKSFMPLLIRMSRCCLVNVCQKVKHFAFDEAHQQSIITLTSSLSSDHVHKCDAQNQLTNQRSYFGLMQFRVSVGE